MSASDIGRSVQKLDEWITANDWKAYDPFDGLSATRFGLGRVKNHYLRIVIQQSVRRLAFNVRPLLGIEPQTSSKGMGFCALGYLHLYRATRDDRYLEKLKYCLDWLMSDWCKDFSGRSWGNHFNYEFRAGTIPRGVPTIVWTSLIANAFLDAHEELGDQQYLETAKLAGEFICNDLSRYEEDDGTFCFMYTPIKKTNLFEFAIHNSNTLGGWLLARLANYNDDRDMRELARRAIGYTANRQLEDGGWYYGEPTKFHWVDSFHTGYVLESLHGYEQATGDDSFHDALVKGYRYFVETFFEEDGLPRYYNYKRYPIDIQCASQGIQTLVNLRQYHDASIPVARKVAEWTIANMQDARGYFYFRKYPLVTNKTPLFHWGQATMLAALAVYTAHTSGLNAE